jgi:hypothetical protein
MGRIMLGGLVLARDVQEWPGNAPPVRSEGQNGRVREARGRVCSPSPDTHHHRRPACSAPTSWRGGGGGFVVSEGHFNSRARKRPSKEPDYWTEAQLSGPARILVDAEAEIVRELNLNQSLRQQLSDCVRLYIDERQAANNTPRVMRAEVSTRLKSLKTAASTLRGFFTENPKAAAARAELQTENPFFNVLGLDPNLAFAGTLQLLRRKSVYVNGQNVLVHGPNVFSNIAIDVDDLCEKLDRLCAFIDKQEKSKGQACVRSMERPNAVTGGHPQGRDRKGTNDNRERAPRSGREICRPIHARGNVARSGNCKF